MLNYVVVGLLLLASTFLCKPSNAQVKQFGRTDVAVSGGKNPKITVLREDVCTLPFFLQGTLTKAPLSPGQPVKIDSCEMYFCTKQDLRDECPGLPENFKVTCQDASATLDNNGNSISITYKYLREKYKGYPVCLQWATKEASDSMAISIPMNSTPPASGQSSSQGPSLGDKVRDKLSCAEYAIIYPRDMARKLHPECQ